MTKSNKRIVIVADDNSGKKYRFVLPADVPVRRLVPELMKHLNLPAKSAGGGIQEYELYLETVDDTIRLQEDETLAAIHNETIIRIIPRIGGDPLLLNVTVIDANGGTAHTTILPKNVPFGLLQPVLISQLNLPIRNPNGTPRRYQFVLESVRGSIQLGDHITLAEFTIREPAIIWISPQTSTASTTPDSSSQSSVAMRSWQYLDFDLQLIPNPGGGFKAMVVDSPGGQASEKLKPLDLRRVENFVLRIGRALSGWRAVNSPEWYEAINFGRYIFERLFYGDVLACFITSLDEAHQQQAGLRIKLRLDEAPKLMKIPWEYLYYPARGIFCGHGYVTSFGL